MIVLVEPLDIDGGRRGAGNYNQQNANSVDILSNITVGEKTITSGKPTFTLYTQNLRMREYDSNDDGNGRNRVQFTRVNPIATDMDEADPSGDADTGSKGTLCFVVFGSKDSLGGGEGITGGEGTTIIP